MMMIRTWWKALPALAVLLSGCDMESTGPELGAADLLPSPSMHSDVAPLTVQAQDYLRLQLGETVQLEMASVAEAAKQNSTEPASDIEVTILVSALYTQVVVKSSADFDATELLDETVTLSTLHGPRVPVAAYGNGNLFKMTMGGRNPSVYYYFPTARLNSGGRAPSASTLMFEGRHATRGLVRGTLGGAAHGPAEKPRVWASTAPRVLSVSPTGLAQTKGVGSAILTFGTASEQDTLFVEVADTVLQTPPPPVASAGDFVVLPSPAVEVILGPQLVAGSSANPWPWFDENATKRGLELCAEFPMTGIGDDLLNAQYYDQGLAHYLNYYRTGNQRSLACARKITDRWSDALDKREKKGYGMTPRGASLGGLILRALDGRPELWPTIERITYYAHRDYVYKVRNLPGVYNIRDGGYALLYVAWLAQVHPDAAKRAEYREQALDGALGYFVRLQEPNGAWFVTEDGKTREQPFMVGLLLEGLIQVHQMTGDEAVKQAILKSVEHLFSKYRRDLVKEERGQGVAWRQVPYFIYPDGTVHGESKLADGWDTNTIREGRQRNSLVVHAYGYAYHITHETKYRTWGDEIFAATYGKGQGPGADAFYGLADFRAKEYNQAYRSAGRYLAWRAM